MGAALPILTAVSMGVQALGSIAQGQQQAASAKYNAQVASNNAQTAQQNARLASEEGNVNTEREQLKTRAMVGGIKAAQAANNIDINSGSAVDVRSSAAELGELNALTVRSNAARQAYGYQTQATSDMAQAKLDKQEAKYDVTAGYVGAASTLLSQGTKAGQQGTWDAYLKSKSLPWQSPGNVNPEGGYY